MNLTGYLAARGAKMLMPCHARAFGVPHPLERHWSEKYGELELTMAQLQDVFVALRRDRRPSAKMPGRVCWQRRKIARAGADSASAPDR